MMPTTIPEWFHPGPEFLSVPVFGNMYPKTVQLKQVCFDAQNIIYMSLGLHFSIILLSILALMLHDRLEPKRSGSRSKTNPLRYAPSLTE